MNKKLLLPILTAVLVLGIGTTCLAASSTDITSSVKSKNTLKYQGADGKVELYSSDIILLARKLSTIPDRPFNPDVYTHTHVWEYIDINETSHTKHCPECGSDNDIAVPHTVSQKESCEISYEGETYHLDKCICECGYQWVEEDNHHLVYESVNDTKHSVLCALNGTEYCSGFQSYNEVHSMEQIIPNNDNMHHTLKCLLCGYEKEEECDFSNHSEISADETEVTWFCQCGNYKTEIYTESNISTNAIDSLSDEPVLDEPTDNANEVMQQTVTNNTDESSFQTPSVASYVSNNDGTHQVTSASGVISTAEPCSMVAAPDTYNNVTGKATYKCGLCNYSVEDDYKPEEE